MSRETFWTWVTGASGFSGPFLLQYLRTIYPNKPLLSLSRNSFSHPAITAHVSIDLQKDNLATLMDLYPPDRIFHLAGTMPPNSDAVLWNGNLATTCQLLSSLTALQRPCRFLQVGSAAEYSANPTGFYRETDLALGASVYGKAKAAQTRLALAMAREFHLDVVVARVFNLVGPGLPERLVSGRLCRQLASGGGELHLGNLAPRRDFIDIRDAVRAYDLIMERAEPFAVVNVCSGVAVTIADLVKITLNLLGDAQPTHIANDPNMVRRQDLNCVYGCNQRLKLLGFIPRISLQDSLGDMLEECQNAIKI